MTVYFKDEKVDHVDKPPEPEKPPNTLPPEALDAPKGPPVNAGATPAALPNALIPVHPRLRKPPTASGRRLRT